MKIPLPLKYVKKSKLVGFKNSKQWQSAGHMSDIQRFIGDEVFYRGYHHLHGAATAKKEYPTHTQLRERVWLAL